MKKLTALILLVLASCTPAYADTQTSLANALALEQITDVLTTRSIITHGGYERDPLAKGVARSTVESAITAIGWNIILRNRHVSLHLLRTVVDLYPVILINNGSMLHKQIKEDRR